MYWLKHRGADTIDGTKETQWKTARGALFSALLAVGLGLAACSPADSPATLYAANCQVCHGDREGRGGTSGVSPHNETGHTWHHPDAQLKDWILNGKIPVAMPPFRDVLTEEEVDMILSHVKSWRTPEQLEAQADISRSYQEALEKQRQS